jgi:hypothetical protein
MKHGASSTIYKTKGNLLNGNHNHHFEAKHFDSVGVKERLCWKFLFTAMTLAVLSSFLKAKM